MALLAVAVLAPGTAWAGCAHDGAGGTNARDHFELLRVCGAMEPETSTRTHAPSSDLPTKVPGGCTGPSCSRGSGLPTVPLSFGVPRASQWAVIDAPPPEAVTRSSRRLQDERDLQPVAIRDAIFHPARRTSLAD